MRLLVTIKKLSNQLKITKEIKKTQKIKKKNQRVTQKVFKRPYQKMMKRKKDLYHLSLMLILKKRKLNLKSNHHQNQ